MTLFALWGMVILAHVHPGAALADLFKGSFGDADKFGRTLEKATPLLIAGLAVYVGLRAGLFNIGAEGQIVIGALACAAVAIKVPGFIGILLSICAGVLAAGLWAWPAGLIKAYRNGHEVITTIMLNNIAGFVAIYLASGILKAPNQESPTTTHVLGSLPSIAIGGMNVNVVVPFSLVLVAGLAFWRSRSVGGFELEATGQNISAARYSGVDTRRVLVRSMAFSGALAGFAGVVQVLAYQGRFYPDISSGSGFDALGVALLAGSSPWGVVPAALAFGALNQAAPLLQIDGLPKGMTEVVLGSLILVGAGIRFQRMARVG